MPTYVYACTECGHQFETVQSFSDSALTECPNCSGRLRKVFNSVGIVFKGSGFYRTDSRGKEPAEASSGSASKDGASGGSDGGSNGAKESASNGTKDSGKGDSAASSTKESGNKAPAKKESAASSSSSSSSSSGGAGSAS